jgi:hypothetical protein
MPDCMSAMKKFTANKGQSCAALSLSCSLFRLGCSLAIDIGPKAVAGIKERDIYNRPLSGGFMSAKGRSHARKVESATA